MSWVQAIARQSKLLLIITILNAVYLGKTLVEAQSKGGNKRKGNARGGKKGSTGGGGGGKKSGAGYSTGMYICLIALLLCFVPAVLVFFYNLYKDPMTPQLIKRLFLSLKDNFTRQLSATNNHQQPTKRYKSSRSTATNNPVDSDFSSVNINMEPSLFDKPKRS
eukprot:gene15984-11436_t